MRHEIHRRAPEGARRSFDAGLVDHAIERETPARSQRLRLLTRALLASSLSALAIPGCLDASESPSLSSYGLDNGTVGQAEQEAPAPLAAEIKLDAA